MQFSYPALQLTTCTLSYLTPEPYHVRTFQQLLPSCNICWKSPWLFAKCGFLGRQRFRIEELGHKNGNFTASYLVAARCLLGWPSGARSRHGAWSKEFELNVAELVLLPYHEGYGSLAVCLAGSFPIRQGRVFRAIDSNWVCPGQRKQCLSSKIEWWLC